MENTRREFFRAAGGFAAASAAIGAPLVLGRAAQAAADGLGAVTTHQLPDLPYAYNALEPYISEEIMQLHHTKHHAAYVRGLNEAETALAQARAAGDFALVQHLSRKAAFNGGGHFLHAMFWKVMAPAGNGGGGEPSGLVAEKIARDFGSFDALKAHFSAAAAGVEGGGWALLHYRPEDDRLIVLQAENQHKLTAWGALPILGIDVWEHAYYLQYKNVRGDYVNAWWNIVNWGAVNANLEALA